MHTFVGTLAAISGESVVEAIIWLVCLGVVFWLLNYLIDYINPPAPFGKVSKVILMIASVVVLINVVMTIAGHPLVKF